jgi:ankyrin repeat protein
LYRTFDYFIPVFSLTTIMTAEPTLPIESDKAVSQEKASTVTRDPGPSIVSRSSKKDNPSLEMGENGGSEPLPLHKKLHAIEEARRTADAATLADFDSLLCEKKCKIDAQDAFGQTALHITIAYGLEIKAQSLIRGGADGTIGDCDGCHPFHQACLEGNSELAILLLNKGANIDAALNNGDTQLAAACRMGHLDIVDLLLEKNKSTPMSLI